MKIRFATLALGLSMLGTLVGCTGSPGSATGSAAIVGHVAPGGGVGKFLTAAQAGCPTFTVTLNGSPADLTVDDDCSFVINNVQPAASYVLAVELTDLGITGAVTVSNVVEAELIEIEVEAGADSLTISIVRRATPDPTGDLPGTVDDNNVEIFLAAGTYGGDLTVDGNNFTLVGEAGDDCEAEGWTILTGNVVILKNNAIFRNVQFLGNVEVQGNNASFVNVCFDGALVIFGHNTEVNDDDDDDGDDGDDDDDDDNDDDDDGNENANSNDNTDDNGNDNGNGGDAQAGQAFYTANGCAGCHGADASGGVGPNIQGESADEISAKLTGGSHPITINITAQEAADLAAYLATF